MADFPPTMEGKEETAFFLPISCSQDLLISITTELLSGLFYAKPNSGEWTKESTIMPLRSLFWPHHFTHFPIRKDVPTLFHLSLLSVIINH